MKIWLRIKGREWKSIAGLISPLKWEVVFSPFAYLNLFFLGSLFFLHPFYRYSLLLQSVKAPHSVFIWGWGNYLNPSLSEHIMERPSALLILAALVGSCIQVTGKPIFCALNYNKLYWNFADYETIRWLRLKICYKLWGSSLLLFFPPIDSIKKSLYCPNIHFCFSHLVTVDAQSAEQSEVLYVSEDMFYLLNTLKRMLSKNMFYALQTEGYMPFLCSPTPATSPSSASGTLHLAIFIIFISIIICYQNM